MTTIYFIRHAEAEGNLYRRIHGIYNSLVTENGLRQIDALEARFRDIHIDAVYSSDLYRTMRTSRAICTQKNLPLITDPALREANLGDWEDRTWGDIGRIDGENLLHFMKSSPLWQAPNGENFAACGVRVADAVLRIAKQHPDQTIAIFCHGAVIRQSCAHIQGLTPDLWPTLKHSDNTAVTQLAFDGETLSLTSYGDNSHLSDEISTLARQNWWKGDAYLKKDVILWFRPLDIQTEEAIYLDARREAWTATHGADKPFPSATFLSDAKKCATEQPWGLSAAIWEDQVVGILQLDCTRYSADSAGYIAFFYIMPDFRKLGLGVQLLGQAVSSFRPLGHTALRLRCAPYNNHAQHFYGKHGFVKSGEEQGSVVPLDILEKYIGFDR